MRCMLLSGGGPRGEVQLQTIRRVREEGPVDAVGGTSIGGQNLLPVLTGRSQDEADAMWASIEHQRDIMRLKDLKVNDGFYSLDPLIDLIRKARFSDHARKIPGWVGVVDGATNKHLELSLNHLNDVDFHDALRCTASIVPYPHEISTFRRRVTTDGGELHVLPTVPEKLIGDVKEIHAVFCSPVYPEQRERSYRQAEVSKLLGLTMAKLDAIITRNVLGDVRILRRHVKRFGIRVYVYAPQAFDDVGQTWDITPDMRKTRRATGEWMANHRILLGEDRQGDIVESG